MTFLGKLLVMINLILSMAAMTWAAGLYTNNVDWSDAPGKGEQPPGKLKVEKDKLTAGLAALVPAENGWKTSRAELLQLEERLPADRAWYAAELTHLRSGATETNPARSLVLDKYEPVPDPANFNRPKMAKALDSQNKPILSILAYSQVSEGNLKEIARAMDLFKKNANKDIDLTNQLVGLGENKGFYQRMIDERLKRDKLIEEEIALRPLLINIAVEYDLLGKRKDGLDERLKELNDYLAKLGKIKVTRAR
jgi:hypothetical protein